MKPEHSAMAQVARSPAHIRRNATLLFISTLTIMSGATISASLPGIAARFADVENVALLSRLVLTLPAVFIAPFSPAAGFLVDRFGHKPLLLVSLALFAASGYDGAYAMVGAVVLVFGIAAFAIRWLWPGYG